VSKARILLVDDEPLVLEGLALRLRRLAITESATSGADGLELLRGSAPFDVVISDMRMPGMDGAAFLAAAAGLAPDTIRILLTGQADLNAAIAAINEGRVFRFLTKPCPEEQLNGALEAALEQRRLIDAERVLLSQTLAGSIRALTQVMAFARPAAVGSSERIKRRLVELGGAMGQETWQVETAAMFTEMGSLLLPPDVAERHYAGRPLQEHDRALVARMPLVAADLLGEIPRLEEVGAVLRACPAAGPGDPWGARALRAVLELDNLEVRGVSGAEAIAVLRNPPGRHDAEILGHLQRLVVGRRVGGGVGGGGRHPADPVEAGTRRVATRKLRSGMILADDVVDSLGRTLLARGIEITPGLERRIAEIEDHVDLGGPVRVYVTAAAGEGPGRA
jgi:CheY-like chemotaxis protein